MSKEKKEDVELKEKIQLFVLFEVIGDATLIKESSINEPLEKEPHCKKNVL